MIDEIFRVMTRNRMWVIRGFKIFYILLIFVLWSGWYRLAPWMGRAAIVAYILTTIPGMARRFRIQHKLIALLMIFRREVGISMYLLATVHYIFLVGLAIPREIFQLMGFTAYVLLFFLFATSNDLSTKHLGAWWGKIHRLTYIAIWFIVMHVALQRVSIWSVAIITTAMLQGLSFFYAKKQKFLRDSGHRDR